MPIWCCECIAHLRNLRRSLKQRGKKKSERKKTNGEEETPKHRNTETPKVLKAKNEPKSKKINKTNKQKNQIIYL